MNKGQIKAAAQQAAIEQQNVAVESNVEQAAAAEPKRKPGRPVEPTSKRQAELKAKLANGEQKKPGRPVDPTSERQQRLAQMALKRENGLNSKQGRPVDPNSERQKRLAEIEKKREINGGIVRRGRPVDPNSPRQQQIRAAAERELQRRLAAAELENANNK
jgi:hypothetical protein